MNRVAFLLCSLTAFLPAAGAPAQANKAPADLEEGFQQVEILARVMELVRQNYVDESRTSYARLMAGALRGMMQELDPHCQFLTPEVFEQLKETPESTAEGSGLTIAPRPGGIVVVSVREDGPAARAGVMPGDQVQKIGALYAAQMTFLDAVRVLRGRPGESLSLTIWRPVTNETRAFEIVRETASAATVRDAMLLDRELAGDAKIGYVRLTHFNGPTATELADALDRLEDDGLQALVLDLRNNPGGLLTGTVEACGEFLPPGTAVVMTEGRPSSQHPPPMKTPARQRRSRTYPLAVLVNHASASGAELMAGALRDLGRAVLVGTTTFGKGSVQSIIPCGGGAALRLTTARYFTPSHQPIHETGVVPDIVAPLDAEEEQRLMAYRRDHSGKPDAAAFAKLGDRQLERAVTALKGVLVYQSKSKGK